MRHFGELQLDVVSSWLIRKINIGNNRIGSFKNLSDLVKVNPMLIIFVAEEEKAEEHFRTYTKVSRHHINQDEIEFAFLYPKDLGHDIGNLRSLLDSDFYKNHEFGIRTYRRSNVGDFKDIKTGVSRAEIEAFVFHSTYVGRGPDLIRDLNTENIMKFFS